MDPEQIAHRLVDALGVTSSRLDALSRGSKPDGSGSDLPQIGQMEVEPIGVISAQFEAHSEPHSSNGDLREISASGELHRLKIASICSSQLNFIFFWHQGGCDICQNCGISKNQPTVFSFRKSAKNRHRTQATLPSAPS